MKVVNKARQEVTVGLKEEPESSRIIVIHAPAAGAGVWGFAYSPSFGKEAKLLRVDVLVQIDPGGLVERSGFSLHRGSGIPGQRQDIEVWERIIDFGTYAGLHGMTVWGQHQWFGWDLTRRFSGEANRFGLLYFNSSTNGGVAHAYFRMSEG